MPVFVTGVLPGVVVVFGETFVFAGAHLEPNTLLRSPRLQGAADEGGGTFTAAGTFAAGTVWD